MTTYSVKSRVLGIGLFVVIAVLVYLIIVSQEQKIMGLEAK